MNLDDRVRSFLANWPIIEKCLNEILQEGIRDGSRSIDDGCRGSEVSEAETPCYLPDGQE